MKRVFPAIIILISLSLLGLIYFQFLWLSTAHQTKENQLRENIYLIATESAEQMMEGTADILQIDRKPTSEASTEEQLKRMLASSVLQRFSKDQINAIITNKMNQHHLKGIKFEFAVLQNSPGGENIHSEGFEKYYNDSTHNTKFVVPLESSHEVDVEGFSLEEYLMVIVPNQESIIFKDIIWFIVGTVLFTLIITAAFFITIRALLQQKKLSEIKSDFINNMTHEFKTPLATISLAVDALKNDQVKKDDDKSAYFIHVIKEENKRMNSQVEAILQAALLDQKNFELQTKAGSVHEYIHQAVKNIQLPLEEKNGTIELELNAANDTVNANDVHFINLINSLLDNAVKYSKDSLKIKVSTQNKANQIQIVISDNGIGMTNETLKRIFEKFYRAHTGNIHNVKGFGLGLSYVKTMVEAHHGTIKANSEIDKGSVFTLSFPTV